MKAATHTTSTRPRAGASASRTAGRDSTTNAAEDTRMQAMRKVPTTVAATEDRGSSNSCHVRRRNVASQPQPGSHSGPSSTPISPSPRSERRPGSNREARWSSRSPWGAAAPCPPPPPPATRARARP